jgi:hypothetical protein
MASPRIPSSPFATARPALAGTSRRPARGVSEAFLALMLVALPLLPLAACGGEESERREESKTEAPPEAPPTPDAPDDANTPEPLPSGFKGYELYTWQEQAGVCFTLTLGTNRGKNRSELGGPTVESSDWISITACGVEALEKTLLRLPAGESVIWSEGRHVYNDAPELPPLSYPEPSIVERMKQLCAERGVELVVIPQ